MNTPINLNMTTDFLSRIHRDVIGDSRFFGWPQDSSSVKPAELARAREQWSARAAASYATQGQLLGMIQRLMQVGAPLEVLSGAIDALQDHHRHTVWLATLTQGLDALEATRRDTRHFTSPDADQDFARAPWLSIGLDALNLFGFNLSLSVPFFDAISAVSSDETISSLSEEIGDDLTHHLEFGWSLLNWLNPQITGPSRNAFEEAIVALMSEYEKLCFAGPDVLDDLAGQEIIVENEEANLGTLSSTQHAAIFYHVTTETLFPKLDELQLEPVEAWHKHYRAPKTRPPRPACVMAVRCTH